MKFLRILHLPWSPGGTRDDRRINSVKDFLKTDIIITEKIDGSNICFTKDMVYARSHSGSPTHKSFDMAKALHAQICHNILDNMFIYGEYIYAVHSIKYDILPCVFKFRN